MAAGAAGAEIDVHLVRRLLAAQFPQWAGLPLRPIDSHGWDNTIYRLGDDLAVRLPRRALGTAHTVREQQWLPVLAPTSDRGVGSSVAAPIWQGPAVWMHGDLHPAHLVIDKARLTGVIDFGLLAVGDPACDLMVAWTFLSAATRQSFRAVLSADDATWARGRGWALDFGLRCAAHATSNAVLSWIGRRTVSAVVSEPP